MWRKTRTGNQVAYELTSCVLKLELKLFLYSLIHNGVLHSFSRNNGNCVIICQFLMDVKYLSGWRI